jgi:glyoxylase-like metal-dependent hydrolase (beta-lactamase superfamily II)
MVLPGHGVGHVNVYALLAADGVLLIDTGWGTEPCMRNLQRALRGIGAELTDVRGILLTHLHADHCGAAGGIAARSGAWEGMHAQDAEMLTGRYFRRGGHARTTVEWVRQCDMPDRFVGVAVAQTERAGRRVLPFAPRRSIGDGDVIRHGHWELTAIHTPGHTRGHLCFYERAEKLLFTGDHVLERINVGPTKRSLEASDPVADYLASLIRLEHLKVSEALPGHQSPITGFADRIAGLRTYHDRRLEIVSDLVASGAGSTVWDVARLTPRSRAWDKITDAGKLSACGEAAAHLGHLESLGSLRRREGTPVRWSPA